MGSYDDFRDPPEDLWHDYGVDDYDPYEDLTPDEISLFASEPQASA